MFINAKRPKLEEVWDEKEATPSISCFPGEADSMAPHVRASQIGRLAWQGHEPSAYVPCNLKQE